MRKTELLRQQAEEKRHRELDGAVSKPPKHIFPKIKRSRGVRKRWEMCTMRNPKRDS